MSERIPQLSNAISIVVLTILSACAAGQLRVVEKLDEFTAVTITYTRTPITMSTDTPFNRLPARDYVDIGAIEVNRTGILQYYLWLGISDVSYMATEDECPEGYESIVLIADGEKIRLDVRGWTAAVIGASEPVYKKLFATSVDAYYKVTLDHIQLLAEADVLKLRMTGSAPKEFVPWSRQTTTKDNFAEFLRTVLR